MENRTNSGVVHSGGSIVDMDNIPKMFPIRISPIIEEIQNNPDIVNYLGQKPWLAFVLASLIVLFIISIRREKRHLV